MARVARKSAVPSGSPVDIICGSLSAKLFSSKLVDGYSRCISFSANGGILMTPCDFERRAGRSAAKNWKKTIRYAGKPIGNFLNHSFTADGKKQLHFVTSSPPTPRAPGTRSHRAASAPEGPTNLSLSASPTSSHPSIRGQPPVHDLQPRFLPSPSHVASPTSAHPPIQTPQSTGSPAGISHPASPILNEPSTVSVLLPADPTNIQPSCSSQQSAGSPKDSLLPASSLHSLPSVSESQPGSLARPFQSASPIVPQFSGSSHHPGNLASPSHSAGSPAGLCLPASPKSSQPSFYVSVQQPAGLIITQPSVSISDHLPTSPIITQPSVSVSDRLPASLVFTQPSVSVSDHSFTSWSHNYSAFSQYR